MIEGYLRRNRPYINVVLAIPRLGLVDAIPFLVDTGADTTIVLPRDAWEMGITYSLDFADVYWEPSFGIGGSSLQTAEPCRLYLRHTDGVIDQFPMPIAFAQPDGLNVNFPSVLGRDILANYRLVLEQLNGIVQLDSPRGR